MVARDFAGDTMAPVFRALESLADLGPEITDDAPDRAAR
jgi:hypothetical protein